VQIWAYFLKQPNEITHFFNKLLKSGTKTDKTRGFFVLGLC